jgi:hypothetical protein
MKVNLERMVTAGVTNALSFGILKGVYTLYENSKFEFVRLPQLVREFIGFRNTMNDTIKKIESVELLKSKGKALKRSS